MKTGNEILDKALQAQKGIGELEVVKSLFYENPISYGELKNNTIYSLINYTYINVLLKDIEAAYNNWNKAIGILEKIVDFSKDYYRQKLDGLKEQMYWLNDHGKQARGLDGMIKDAIIFKTGNYEDSPNAQQRINQVCERYSLKLKSTVEQIEKRFLDIIYGNKSKDTRPLVEKLKPVIDQFQPEQAELFINGLKTHVKPEINLIALEINILMQQPTNILQLYFTEPNDEEQRMIEELKAQLEKMHLKFEEQNREKTQALEQVAERDRIIEEQKNIISEQKMENLELTAKLEQKILENEDLVLKLQSSETKLIPLQERIAELKAENKELKDDKTELREDKKILIEDKKILQEEKKVALDEKKLLAEEKKYYFDLSKELTQKVSEKDIAITNLNLLVEQEHFKYEELHEKYVALLGEQ